MQEQHGITESVETEATETGQEQTQVETKMFTQEQVNEIIAKRVGQVKNKFADIDPQEYNELRKFRESVEEEQLINRNEFDKVLNKHKEKSNAEIAQLRGELERIKVDGALINTASKAGAIAPEQVAKLLKEQVRLQADGSVAVMDTDGNPRYDDNAELYTVDRLVEEFLATNQYFKAAGPSGVGSTSNTGKPGNNDVDLASLDMTNPDHRKIYKEMRKAGKL